MDLFFETAPVADKRRAHFHAFMADVHARVHAYRQKVTARRGPRSRSHRPGRRRSGRVRPAAVLRRVQRDRHRRCDDPGSAVHGPVRAGRHSGGDVERGAEPPYEGGLNRALFLPFLALLGQRMDIVMLDARTDFRLEKLGGAEVWHVPADEAQACAGHAFRRLTGGTKPVPVILSVKGRELLVPQAAQGVARFSFEELCERPLGASDYLAIAEPLSHGPARRRSGDGFRPAQRRQAVHHIDRRVL